VVKLVHAIDLVRVFLLILSELVWSALETYNLGSKRSDYSPAGRANVAIPNDHHGLVGNEFHCFGGPFRLLLLLSEVWHKLGKMKHAQNNELPKYSAERPFHISEWQR
jgi:hypothetical protein